MIRKIAVFAVMAVLAAEVTVAQAADKALRKTGPDPLIGIKEAMVAHGANGYAIAHVTSNDRGRIVTCEITHAYPGKPEDYADDCTEILKHPPIVGLLVDTNLRLFFNLDDEEKDKKDAGGSR